MKVVQRIPVRIDFTNLKDENKDLQASSGIFGDAGRGCEGHRETTRTSRIARRVCRSTSRCISRYGWSIAARYQAVLCEGEDKSHVPPRARRSAWGFLIAAQLKI